MYGTSLSELSAASFSHLGSLGRGFGKSRPLPTCSGLVFALLSLLPAGAWHAMICIHVSREVARGLTSLEQRPFQITLSLWGQQEEFSLLSNSRVTAQLVRVCCFLTLKSPVFPRLTFAGASGILCGQKCLVVYPLGSSSGLDNNAR